MSTLAGFYIAEPIHPLILRKLKTSNAAGGGVPATKVIYAESQFLRDVDSEYSKIKFVGSFMADQTLYTRYALNIDPVGSPLSITGTPSLSNFKGWSGNPGTTNYLQGSAFDTGFGLATTNLSLAAFISETGALGSGFNIIGGLHSSDTGTILQYQPAGIRGLCGTGIGSNIITAVGLSNNDYFHVWRTDNVNHYIGKNGTQIGTGAVAAGSQSTQTTWKVLNIQRSSAATGAPSDFIIGGVCLSLGTIDSAKMALAFQNLKIRVN